MSGAGLDRWPAVPCPSALGLPAGTIGRRSRTNVQGPVGFRLQRARLTAPSGAPGARCSGYAGGVIKYIGSKRLLAAEIAETASRLGADSICDLFAGTTRVGQACGGAA